MNRDAVDKDGSQAPPRGLVMLDVDGVLFRGQLMIALARRRGAGHALQIANQ